VAKGSDPYSDEVSSGQVTTVPVEELCDAQNESERSNRRLPAGRNPHMPLHPCILRVFPAGSCTFPGLAHPRMQTHLSQFLSGLNLSCAQRGHRKWCEANGITSRWASMAWEGPGSAPPSARPWRVAE